MNNNYGSNVSNNTYTTTYTSSQQTSSNIGNSLSKKERPVTSFIKQTNKYTVSDASPDVKEQGKYQSSGISRMSPSRF